MGRTTTGDGDGNGLGDGDGNGLGEGEGDGLGEGEVVVAACLVLHPAATTATTASPTRTRHGTTRTGDTGCI